MKVSRLDWAEDRPRRLQRDLQGLRSGADVLLCHQDQRDRAQDERSAAPGPRALVPAGVRG